MRLSYYNHLFLIFFIFILTACSYGSKPTPTQLHGARGALQPGGDYIVKKGDTLFRIAWQYGLDINELARWNGIENKDRIHVGQRLRTTPPQGVRRQTVVAPQVTSKGQSGWRWPTRGQVVQGFSPSEPGKQGLRFRGSRGQAVNAAADGEVAYSGTGLSGFGRMVILRHRSGVLSAYGYLDRVNVSEGQRLKAGQQIGTMGIGNQNQPTLHFEIRQQGKPVNPYSYIGTEARY